MGPPRAPSTKDTERSHSHKVSDPGLHWGISAVEVNVLVHLLYNNGIVCRMPRSRLAFGLQWSYIPLCTRNSDKVGNKCNQLHAFGPVSCYLQPKQDVLRQEKTGRRSEVFFFINFHVGMCVLYSVELDRVETGRPLKKG